MCCRSAHCPAPLTDLLAPHNFLLLEWIGDWNLLLLLAAAVAQIVI